MRPVLVFLFCTAALCVFWSEDAHGAGECFVFSCGADNDLYRVMRENGLECRRYDTPAEAAEKAPEGAGLLILADGYPMNMTAVYGEVLDRLAEKKLRCYLEFPCHVPGLEPDKVRAVSKERLVVASEAFGAELPPMRILSINSCRFIPYKGVKKAHLVLAKVAGFDTAVYGLPAETYPILFEAERGDLLVATTKLSHFVQARYGPQAGWQSVWKMVLGWLQPGKEIGALQWTATVRPSFAQEDPLPKDAEKQAFERGVKWFERALEMPMHEELRRRTDRKKPVEDGFFECYFSGINLDGSQPIGSTQRNDCNGEAMFALAMGDALLKGNLWRRAAENIGDWLYLYSHNTKGPRAHPASPSYGQMGWSNTSPDVYYSDDQARCMLGTIGCSVLLKDDRWDERMARCLAANLRICGTNGFQRGRRDEDNLQYDGWRYYHDQPVKIEYSPHYVSWIWACYLWGYQQSGHEPFLTQAKKGMQTLVEAYPDGWKWTNGIQQERARLLLPLAWLVRVEDTAEHRGWLMKIAKDLIDDQAECGAIREELGDLEKGSYPPPQKNDDFGNYEAALIQENGDPACDLLYTTNFAFLSLHEAVAATGEPVLREAEEKLAKFLCRIQIRSEKRPELDGGWYRGFDFGKWEYWASDADVGWGVWCIESGWTQAWITSVLGLRHMQTSLWELACRKETGPVIRTCLKEMIPGT